jgi:serine/threonine protein kinase
MQLLDLIDSMLKTNPEERIDAAMALNHKFFTSVFTKKETLKEQVLKSLQ